MQIAAQPDVRLITSAGVYKDERISIQYAKTIIAFHLTNTMYRRTRDITPYWLFVKDIQAHLQIGVDYAHAIASLIWPSHLQREEYKAEAKLRKEKLKEYGAFYITNAYLLNNDTRLQLQQYEVSSMSSNQSESEL